MLESLAAIKYLDVKKLDLKESGGVP